MRYVPPQVVLNPAKRKNETETFHRRTNRSENVKGQPTQDEQLEKEAQKNGSMTIALMFKKRNK